jgi:hypothetical protein
LFLSHRNWFENIFDLVVYKKSHCFHTEASKDNLTVRYTTQLGVMYSLLNFHLKLQSLLKASYKFHKQPSSNQLWGISNADVGSSSKKMKMTRGCSKKPKKKIIN